jgi:hypothetical protein
MLATVVGVVPVVTGRDRRGGRAHHGGRRGGRGDRS